MRLLRRVFSYEAPVYAKVQLMNNKTGEIKEQEIFVTDLPIMTDEGVLFSMVIGELLHIRLLERRVFCMEESDKLPTRTLYKVRLMPGKGPWYEIDTNRHNVISMRILPKRPKALSRNF